MSVRLFSFVALAAQALAIPIASISAVIASSANADTVASASAVAAASASAAASVVVQSAAAASAAPSASGIASVVGAEGSSSTIASVLPSGAADGAPSSTTASTAALASASITPANNAGGTSGDICSLTPNDPASWGPSGATQYMQDWFNANGTSNWLTAMDQSTTTIGGFDSVLDCKPLGGNTCPAPVTPCIDFTPEVLRFVRIAATNAHDFFTMAHEQLQDTTISDILSIDQIIADFAPDEPPAGFNYVNAVAGGFFIASSVAGLFGEAAGPAGAILGLIGGFLNFANAVNPLKQPIDQTDEWQRVVSDQLGATFTTAADSISGINNKLFGGDDDFDLGGYVQSLQAAGALPNDGLNPITEIFSTGAFLADQDESTLTDALKAGYARVKQSLVAGLFRAQNFYVFINTQLTEGECTATGSRFINNECMIISKRTTGGSDSDTEPVAAEILLKLDDSNAGYNIDVIEMYQNALDCNSAQLDMSVTPGKSLPKCFWSLPILRVDGSSVCSLIPSGDAAAPGYASGVQLTLAAC